MKIISLFLGLVSLNEAANPKYKQHGSLVDERQRSNTEPREYGNAVMKRFPKDGADEISFKVGSEDYNIRIAFASDNDALEYSVALPGSEFKNLQQLSDEGNPTEKGPQSLGKGKTVPAQGVKLKRGDGPSGAIKVKAEVKPGKGKQRGSQHRRPFQESTTVVIMNHGSDVTACFEPVSLTNYVEESATFKVGLCDRTTGMLYTDAVTSGTLTFDAGDGDDSGSVAMNATPGTDGWATVSFSPQMNSTYSLQFDIDALNNAGEELERQVVSAVQIVEKQIASVASVFFAMVDDDIEMTTTVDLFSGFSPSGDESYIVYAEVAGPSGNIMTAAGMADLESDNSLQLLLQTDWFEGKSDPFTIKYLRISTPDGTIPLIIEENLQVVSSLPDVIRPNRRRLEETDEERIQRMAMGVKPAAHYSVSQDAGNLRKLSNSTDHGLLLVHGYCAHNNPWDTFNYQASELRSGPHALLQDFHRNRNHNSFAQVLRAFGDQYTGCGIVAHSQGGNAALHLYAHYWSCLDYATEENDGRLIQTVGTPYQGTALAGNIDILGRIFGIGGCGANLDMTYYGARYWLAGIPYWARSQVHYYTTSFKDYWWRYDYCDPFSGLFLSDPDDGAVERWAGQLNGGNNRGHTEGQCHTSSMAFPHQTRDRYRNEEMADQAKI